MSTDSDPSPAIEPQMRTLGRVPAGIPRRAAAYLIDLVLVGGVVVAAARRSGRTRERQSVVAIVLALVVGTLYHVVLEGSIGRTAGKAAAGLVVVREDGTPCTVRSATVRTALRIVDWLPAGYLIGVLAIRLTERRQRLGDIAAGTVVVRRRNTGEERV